MSNKPLIFFNIGLLGLVLWLVSRPQPAPEVTAVELSVDQAAQQEIAALRDRIRLLERDLDEEIAARIDLESRLDNYSPSFAQADIDGNTLETLPLNAQTEQDFDEPLAIVEQASIEDQLLTVGLPLETIQAMKRSVDQNQLRMLELRDQAIREGWSDSDEFRQQMSGLQDPYQKLREEFGDEAYDQYLYASGIPNRVQIQEVYTGSAADYADLRPGDIVVSYADNSIYSMSTLRESTLEGLAGETILLEINRDGRTISASVPRGPLGISMSAVISKPE